MEFFRFYFSFWSLFLLIHRSKNARSEGSKNKIKSVEQRVPWEIVLQILEAIKEAKQAMIKVTIIKIELEVKMVEIDWL